MYILNYSTADVLPDSSSTSGTKCGDSESLPDGKVCRMERLICERPSKRHKVFTVVDV